MSQEVRALSRVTSPQAAGDAGKGLGLGTPACDPWVPKGGPLVTSWLCMLKLCWSLVLQKECSGTAERQLHFSSSAHSYVHIFRSRVWDT